MQSIRIPSSGEPVRVLAFGAKGTGDSRRAPGQQRQPAERRARACRDPAEPRTCAEATRPAITRAPMVHWWCS